MGLQLSKKKSAYNSNLDGLKLSFCPDPGPNILAGFEQIDLDPTSVPISPILGLRCLNLKWAHPEQLARPETALYLLGRLSFAARLFSTVQLAS